MPEISYILYMFEFTDRITHSTRFKTKDGFLRGSAALTRSGLIKYRAKELGIKDREPDEIVTVYRKPEHVFNDVTMESIRGAIITLEHPSGGVKPDTWKKASVGSVVGEPERKGDLLVSDVLIGEKTAIDKIEKSDWDELSVGYSHDMKKVASDENKHYDYETSSPLTINHVAIVERGRAGNRVRIFDSKSTEENTMPEITLTQINDAIHAALKSRDADQERKEAERSTIEKTVQDTVVSTLQDKMPDILAACGIDMGKHEQDIDPMFWKKVPVGKNYKPKTDEEDEKDMGNQGHMKTRKRKTRPGWDKNDSSDYLSERIAAVAGDADSESITAATDIAKTVLKDEMARIKLMKDVSFMLSDEQKKGLKTAPARDIMIAALGDSVTDAEDKSDDYLRAMVDMAKSQQNEAGYNADETPGNVYNFDQMPMTMRRGQMKSKNSGTVKVVGSDNYGEITDSYQDYVTDLEDAWMDEEDRNTG